MKTQPTAWRATRAGTMILAIDGADCAHVWRALSGRVAASVWADGPDAIRYFETTDTLEIGMQWVSEKMKETQHAQI